MFERITKIIIIMIIKNSLKFISLVLLLLVYSCGGGGEAGFKSDTTEVMLNLGLKEPMMTEGFVMRSIPFDVDNASITISGPGMQPIVKTINNINPGTIVQSIFIVPSGLSRKFSINAFNSSNTLLYFGTASRTLTGRPISIDINMFYFPCDRFVWVSKGSDTSNDCSAVNNTCRTITHAISQASAGESICVSPGTYDISTGESFPLDLARNLSIVCQGPDKSTVIDGKGSGQNTIVVSETGALVIGCNVRADNSASAIADNINAPVSVDNCLVEPSPGTDNNRGVFIVSDSSLVIGSTLRNFKGGKSSGEGISVSDASPAIGYNDIYKNTVGIKVNLGQPAINNNQIVCNDFFNLAVFSPNQIDARYNSWNNSPPVVGLADLECSEGNTDICYSDGGSGWGQPLFLPDREALNCL